MFGVHPVRRGKELMFYCPACRHHKKKLSFDIRQNVGKCWICNEHHTITGYLKKYGSVE